MASDISSPPCLLRLLPAGANRRVGGGPPLESAALSRRTPFSVTQLRIRNGCSCPTTDLYLSRLTSASLLRAGQEPFPSGQRSDLHRRHYLVPRVKSQGHDISTRTIQWGTNNALSGNIFHRPLDYRVYATNLLHIGILEDEPFLFRLMRMCQMAPILVI
jgi:hypothetical protein